MTERNTASNQGCCWGNISLGKLRKAETTDHFRNSFLHFKVTNLYTTKSFYFTVPQKQKILSIYTHLPTCGKFWTIPFLGKWAAKKGKWEVGVGNSTKLWIWRKNLTVKKNIKDQSTILSTYVFRSLFKQRGKNTLTTW